jgi:hypothetical protein
MAQLKFLEGEGDRDKVVIYDEAGKELAAHTDMQHNKNYYELEENTATMSQKNTCLPPSSSRLMIHRHSSVASRPRNARGMLRRASGRAERDGARGEASTHSGLRPAYRAAVLR